MTSPSLRLTASRGQRDTVGRRGARGGGGGRGGKEREEEDGCER